MSNYNEMVGETVMTDAGEHTILAHVHDDGCCDESINLYVGRDAKGYCNLIASDNASEWVVGDEDDAERNRDHWDMIESRCDVAPVLDEVRKIDAQLADWLGDRYREAVTALVIVKRADYDVGDTSDCTVVKCSEGDDYDAISEAWDNIGIDDVIIRGLGDCEVVLHLANVTWETRTIDGLEDLTAPFYVAGYDREYHDGDCSDWEYYAADGRRLTTEEAFRQD